MYASDVLIVWSSKFMVFRTSRTPRSRAIYYRRIIVLTFQLSRMLWINLIAFSNSDVSVPVVSILAGKSSPSGSGEQFFLCFVQSWRWHFPPCYWISSMVQICMGNTDAIEPIFANWAPQQGSNVGFLPTYFTFRALRPKRHRNQVSRLIRFVVVISR